MTGAELALWRASVGLSQQEVADRLGMSLRGWQYWEAEERANPGLLLVRALRDLERELAEERK